MGVYRAWLEEEIPHLDDTNDPDGQIKELEDIIADNDANEEEQNDAQEAAFGPDGGVDDIMEESWLAIAEFEQGHNDIMKAIGAHELNEAVDGREFLFESMDDVKGFFKKAKDKVVEFFKKVWSVLQRWAGNLAAAVRSNKALAEKYATQITNGASLIQREKGREKMKGYPFSGTPNIERAVAAKQYKVQTDRNKLIATESDDYKKMQASLRKGILGTDCSASEFATKLRNLLYTGDVSKSETVNLWMNPKEILEVLRDKKDAVKEVKDFTKQAKVEFKEALSTLKDMERDASKEDSDEHKDKSKYMSGVIRAYDNMKYNMSVMQICRTQVLRAVNAESRQARRYAMAYIAAYNRNDKRGFKKDSDWREKKGKNESAEYGFLGNLGLI